MALNHYNHYRHSEAATKMYEVVSPALFEVDMTFPQTIEKSMGNHKIHMIEHVRSISGLDGVTPNVGNVVQKYKFAERHYAAAGPDKTSLELQITYTMNLNNAHENYIYNMLRKWYNIIYNPQNGQMFTKKQYADGSRLYITEYDRSGDIWRKITCFNFFPSTPPTGLNEDNYDSVGDAKTVSITFMVDDWVEQIVGIDDYREPSGGEFTRTDILEKGEGVEDSKLGNIYNQKKNK